MPVAALASTLHVLDVFGLTEPTVLQGPIRQSLVKFGDGLFVEEGTTNLVTNPSAAVDTTGWTVGTGNATISRDTTRGRYGAASFKVTVTAAGDVNVLIAHSALAAGNAAGAVDIYSQRGTVIDVTAGTVTTRTTGVALNRWQRVRSETAAGAISSAMTVVYNGAVVGDVFWLDAAQVEQRAYATSYADGSLATDWNAPGNQLPAAAQSFEDGTTGGWVAIANLTTLDNSAVTAAAGTKSLRLIANGAGAAQVRSPSVAVTPGKTHTVSAKMYAGYAINAFVQIVYFAADGVTNVSDLSGSAEPMVAGAFRRLAVTHTAPATAAFAQLRVIFNAPVAADTFYVDAARIEEGTGSAAYRWNGAENASTSTRTGAAQQFTISSSAPLTFCAWVRVPARGVAAAVGSATDLLGSNGSILTLRVGVNGANSDVALYNGTSTTTAGASSGAQAGDLLFMAATFDGSTLTGYTSRNGGAIVSSTGAQTLPAGVTFTSANISRSHGLAGGLNGAVEQVLVYNAALSLAEITALAFAADPTGLDDDSRIVFAAATGTARGTVQAETLTGTGSYRSARTVLASLEPFTASGANPDDDISEFKATVPAGSGVGQGQAVAFTNPAAGPGAEIYTVDRVFAPGGVHDELLLSRIA